MLTSKRCLTRRCSLKFYLRLGMVSNKKNILSDTKFRFCRDTCGPFRENAIPGVTMEHSYTTESFSYDVYSQDSLKIHELKQGFTTVAQGIGQDVENHRENIYVTENGVVEDVNHLLFKENFDADNFVSKNTIAFGNVISDASNLKENIVVENVNLVVDENAVEAADFQHEETRSMVQENQSSTDNRNLRDVKIASGICNFLNSEGWNASTEVFLHDHYSEQLSDQIVASVILRQINVDVAKLFFQWATKWIGFGAKSCTGCLIKFGETKQFYEMWSLLTQLKDRGDCITADYVSIIIKAYGTVPNLDMAVSAFRKAVLEYNLLADSHMFTALLKVFFMSNFVAEARLIYKQMLVDGVKLDSFTFSALIRGFAKSLYIADAQKCFDEMRAEGLVPDISAYDALIAGLCFHDAVMDAKAVFSDLQESRLKPTVSIFNLLIAMFCRAGKINDATNLFASMRTDCLPNQATFNLILQGLFKANKTMKAIEFFQLMEKEGWADARSYIHLSNGLRQAKQSRELLSFLQDMVGKHGFDNIEICNALLHNHSYLGNFNEAEKTFRGIVSASKEPNLPSYAVMINCYCRMEKINEAADLIAELTSKGFKPSSFCYTPVISAFLKADRVADAMKLFLEMLGYGLEVNGITCSFLLGELCKRGMVDDAIKVCNVVLDNRLSIRSCALFLFMKCLCKVGRGEEANRLFMSMWDLNCLPKNSDIRQAFGVMHRMQLNS